MNGGRTGGPCGEVGVCRGAHPPLPPPPAAPSRDFSGPGSGVRRGRGREPAGGERRHVPERRPRPSVPVTQPRGCRGTGSGGVGAGSSGRPRGVARPRPGRTSGTPLPQHRKRPSPSAPGARGAAPPEPPRGPAHRSAPGAGCARRAQVLSRSFTEKKEKTQGAQTGRDFPLTEKVAKREASWYSSALKSSPAPPSRAR